MKLHLTTESERGKPVTKSGNDYIEIKVKGEDRKDFLELKIINEETYYRIEGYIIEKSLNRSERYISYEVLK